MSAHLFQLKKSAFVLWRVRRSDPPPKLIIGTFQAGNPPSLANARAFVLSQVAGHPDLWSIAAASCGLVNGQVYHYWFEVNDSSPYREGGRILCSDPTAFSLDWRLLAPLLPAPYTADDRDPAAVVKWQNAELLNCDAAGEVTPPPAPISAAQAPANNRLVIYELPTGWARMGVAGDPELAAGSFRDVLALVDENAAPANFAGVRALAVGQSHLQELGANALELLPIADSFVAREWGYATSNYFAPDYDLGLPVGNMSPTANRDLCALIDACHARGIRFFLDVVMAFGTRAPLENVNFPEFHVSPSLSPDDPEILQSSNQGVRTDFGGALFRYGREVDDCYDPVTGARTRLVVARRYMLAYLLRWLGDYRADGIRVDSVNNVANWDFVQQYKDLARASWRALGGSDETFLVVGEELSVPLDLLRQQRLDSLWNERFKFLVRAAIRGLHHESEPNFEWTVRKLIDCRLLGFQDGTQAVNYLGSHDVEGYQNERLFDFLVNNQIFETEQRIKLAFACLLTAVGIPMILAGDEFADAHDLPVRHPEKQRDSVNYDRLNDPFRRRVFEYVARLVRLRTTHPALAVNDTRFIHIDFDHGKRVLVWQRGGAGQDPVVVVANFSDFATPDPFNSRAHYAVPNWPATPEGRRWHEITQDRAVPEAWVAREPLFAWEAKVYTLV